MVALAFFEGGRARREKGRWGFSAGLSSLAAALVSVLGAEGREAGGEGEGATEAEGIELESAEGACDAPFCSVSGTPALLLFESSSWLVWLGKWTGTDAVSDIGSELPLLLIVAVRACCSCLAALRCWLTRTRLMDAEEGL